MKSMRTTIIVLLLCSFYGIAPAGQNGLECLKLTAAIRLPGKPDRFDYQSIDQERGLLFISHLGDNSVAVFDVSSGRMVRDIRGIPGPHGILAVPTLGRVFVSATKVNEVYTIDENTFRIIGKTPAGYFPDGIGYSPEADRIFVSDEFGGTVSVINAKSLRLIRKIRIGRQVGNTHYDPVSRMIVTADESGEALVQINPVTLGITGRLGLPGCRGAHGFITGTAPHFAYVTGEDNASLLVVDLAEKKVVQTFSVGAGPDVLAIDRAKGLLYVSSESGIVSVFKIGSDGISEICTGFLWAHAHTVSVNQKTGRVYFPIQDYRGAPTLLIFDPVN